MVQCSGKDCNKVNVPFVDTILKRTDGLNQKRKFSQSSQNKYFVTINDVGLMHEFFKDLYRSRHHRFWEKMIVSLTKKGFALFSTVHGCIIIPKKTIQCIQESFYESILTKNLNETLSFHKFLLNSKITPDEKPKKCLHLTDSKRTKTIDFANQDFVIKIYITW